MGNANSKIRRQIIPPSHNSSMQQLLNQVKDLVCEKQRGKIELLCNNYFQIKLSRTRVDFKGGGMLRALILLFKILFLLLGIG